MPRDFKFPSGFNHKVLGNTWRVTDDGHWFLPEKTLGWDIAGWCSRYLTNDQGQPWRFTNEQLRFLLWWYAVDERGRFKYRTGVLQRLKGWGKDPFAAALALAELAGPSKFAYFDPDGNPIGKRHPNAFVTINAVSEFQTRNTSDVLQWMVSKKMKREFSMQIGVEKVTAFSGRCQMVFAASSYRAMEGKRPTFSILNETQHWVAGNGGHQMYETLNGNLTKSANGVARMLAITNAYQPGEDSVGESMRQAYLEQHEFDLKYPGERIGSSIMYDSLEADETAPLDAESIMKVIEDVRGDSVWLDPESIVSSFYDRSISVSHNRRMFYNQIVAKEDALFSEAEWDACMVPESALDEGDEVVLGFDGGRTDDATALIAKRVSDGLVVPIAVWEKPGGPAGDDWVIDHELVSSHVHWCFRTFKVLAFYADVALWESFINQWSDEYRDQLLVKASSHSAIGFDMRGGQQKITRANEALMTAVFDKKFKHNGNRVLRRHALNTRRRENRYGTTFGKESRESPLKVDAYAATLLCEMAYRDLMESGKTVARERNTMVVAY